MKSRGTGKGQNSISKVKKTIRFEKKYCLFYVCKQLSKQFFITIL